MGPHRPGLEYFLKNEIVDVTQIEKCSGSVLVKLGQELGALPSFH